MTHRGPFQPLPFCDSELLPVYFNLATGDKAATMLYNSAVKQ